MMFCCFGGKRVLNFKISFNNKYTITPHVAIYTEYWTMYSFMLELVELEAKNF